MDKCYLCGNFFNKSDTLKHDEHIIQQAIGGVFFVNRVVRNWVIALMFRSI